MVPTEEVKEENCMVQVELCQLDGETWRKEQGGNVFSSGLRGARRASDARDGEGEDKVGRRCPTLIGFRWLTRPF